MWSGELYPRKDTVSLGEHIHHPVSVRFYLRNLSVCLILYIGKEISESSNISPNTDWRLEITRDVENPAWTILYAFSENEFFMPDHESASYSVCMAPGMTIFWSEIIITKHFLLTDEECATTEIAGSIEKVGGTVGVDTGIDRQRGTWLGQYILTKDRVKRQVGAQSETIMEFKDEIQRIHAVREIFGIDIDDSAAEYIEGRAPALSKDACWQINSLHLSA